MLMCQQYILNQDFIYKQLKARVHKFLEIVTLQIHFCSFLLTRFIPFHGGIQLIFTMHAVFPSSCSKIFLDLVFRVLVQLLDKASSKI